MSDFIHIDLFDKDPIARVMDDINAAYGLAKRKPGKHGWNFWSKFLACPHQAWLIYHERVDRDLRQALEVGIAVHGFLEWHYLGLEPAKLKEELIGKNVTIEWVIEAWRLYQAYAIHFSSDALFDNVLAIEEWLIHPNYDYCARQDLVVDVAENAEGFKPGLWIVDHKTSGRFDEATLNCWAHDGEMLGLMMTYYDLGQPRGPLNGVIVNIIGKQKVPKFHRLAVTFSHEHIARHRAALVNGDTEKRYLEGRQPPRDQYPWARRGHATGACVTKFGVCEFYERCWGVGG